MSAKPLQVTLTTALTRSMPPCWQTMFLCVRAIVWSGSEKQGQVSYLFFLLSCQGTNTCISLKLCYIFARFTLTLKINYYSKCLKGNAHFLSCWIPIDVVSETLYFPFTSLRLPFTRTRVVFWVTLRVHFCCF